MSNEKYSAMPPLPRMSFFRHPIRNIRPCREASPEDIFKYLISDYAKARTETLRSIADIKKRREYKAGQFDYITPGGIFRTRKETDLIQASGYIVIDFDHVSDPLRLVIKLAGDDNFETVLAFRSPSGDGVKWIVSLPDATKPDGTMRKLTDVSKLHRLGWHHKVGVDEGIHCLYEWYLKGICINHKS